MHHPLNLTIDLYLQRMAARGEFDHLEGEGQPLEGLSEPAPSVLDRILQEADARPVVVLLNRKQVKIRDRLSRTHNPQERREIMRELADVQTRMAVELESYHRFG